MSVPMGGILTPADGAGEAPVFTVMAARDPKGANLDRIQMIKGWLDADGKTHERIYNLAWSGDRELASDGTLPAVGSTVDADSASYDNSIGESQLSAEWQDPTFDSSESAFYYVRVLEIPTPRNSQYDAVALGGDVETGFPAEIQERAYTSAIWYRPVPAD